VLQRLLVEALFENERKKTDTHLQEERVHTDRETQAAIVTRDQFVASFSHDLRNYLVGKHVQLHASFNSNAVMLPCVKAPVLLESQSIMEYPPRDAGG